MRLVEIIVHFKTFSAEETRIYRTDTSGSLGDIQKYFQEKADLPVDAKDVRWESRDVEEEDNKEIARMAVFFCRDLMLDFILRNNLTPDKIMMTSSEVASWTLIYWGEKELL